MRKLCFLIAFTFASVLCSGQEVLFTNAVDGKYLGKSVSVLSDPDQKLSISDVISRADSFKPYPNEVVNLGVTTSNH